MPLHALIRLSRISAEFLSQPAGSPKKYGWGVYLGTGELAAETIKSSGNYVCRLYNAHNTYSVHTACHLLFSETMKREAMAKTSDAVRFHLMRVHCQAMIWGIAHCPISQFPALSEMGWKLDKSGLQPVCLLCQQVLFLTVALRCIKYTSDSMQEPNVRNQA